ncbi:MAG: GNAT family N-acetyltransferase [Clostridia bacterium]|jgi:ribosomal protein S18 acetylase RimI-like enzyme|nr:GNAT family N-acetyltransferase [Clostridia bacterium]MBT7121641.1 GNAT family N-acetyltransferase [Clostridia bacterium]
MTYIQSTNKLSPAQVESIRALEKACAALDGTSGDLWLDNEFNLHENMPCFFLLFDKDALQGVLTIFAPAGAPAEISAKVLPQCRRQGHFKAMLSKASEQLGIFGIHDVFFVHETKSTAGKQMIDEWNISPHHSEYLLVYDKKYTKISTGKIGLQLAKAEQKDFEQMLKLNAAIFGKEVDYNDILKKSMTGENILCYKVLLGGAIIGVCNVNRTNNELFIFGLGIEPAHRGNGFGRALLAELIAQLTQNYQDDIMLEVDSENAAAHALYTTSGFIVKTQYDYYERTTDDIATSLGTNG